MFEHVVFRCQLLPCICGTSPRAALIRFLISVVSCCRNVIIWPKYLTLSPLVSISILTWRLRRLDLCSFAKNRTSTESARPRNRSRWVGLTQPQKSHRPTSKLRRTPFTVPTDRAASRASTDLPSRLSAMASCMILGILGTCSLSSPGGAIASPNENNLLVARRHTHRDRLEWRQSTRAERRARVFSFFCQKPIPQKPSCLRQTHRAPRSTHGVRHPSAALGHHVWRQPPLLALGVRKRPSMSETAISHFPECCGSLPWWTFVFAVDRPLVVRVRSIPAIICLL